MLRLAARGVEIAWSERGDGAPVLLIHETGASSAACAAVAEAVSARARAISYDRRGWGESSAPDGYRRTTVEEQSEDAAALIESLDQARAVLCGTGLGAVIALDLLLRRPELTAGAVLIEPPLLQLLPAATEGLSTDRRALEAAAGEGRDAIVELYLSGGLGAMAAGVGRPQTAAGRRGAPVGHPHRGLDPAAPARGGGCAGWSPGSERSQGTRLGGVAATSGRSRRRRGGRPRAGALARRGKALGLEL